MEKKFEITFSYWKQKKIKYFDILPDLDKCSTYVMESKVIKAETSKEAEIRLQSIYAEPLHIIRTIEIQQQKEIIFNGR